MTMEDEETQLISVEGVQELEGLWAKFKRGVSLLTVEPILFLIVVAFGISSTVQPALILERTCRVNLNFSEAVCDDLANHKSEQERCQIYANDIMVYVMVLLSVPSIFASLFVGPWTDLNGRKPVMVVPMVFNFLSQLSVLAVVYFRSLPVEWILVSAVTGLGGGFSTFLIGIFGYITDITTVESRTVRVAFTDAFFFIGFPFGTYLSGIIFKNFGYFAIFGTSAALYFVAVLYIAVFITDSRGPRLANISTDDDQRGERIFHYSQVVSTFRTCFKRRSLRSVIIILMMVIAVHLSIQWSNKYFYVKLMYDWSVEDYTNFSSISTVFQLVGSYLILPYLGYTLGLHDAVIGVLSGVSLIASYLTLTFSFYPWVFWLGTMIGMFGSIMGVLVRSLLSKVTPKDDIGKIFALLGCLEAVSPLISSFVFTGIYNSTIGTFPGYIFLFIACLCTINTFGMLYVFHKLQYIKDGELQN